MLGLNCKHNWIVFHHFYLELWVYYILLLPLLFDPNNKNNVKIKIKITINVIDSQFLYTYNDNICNSNSKVSKSHVIFNSNSLVIKLDCAIWLQLVRIIRLNILNFCYLIINLKMDLQWIRIVEYRETTN